jgi:glycosyltransferase involved in cell wall biosynthesis
VSLRIYVDTGAFSDRRGMGRVSNELGQALSKISKPTFVSGGGSPLTGIKRKVLLQAALKRLVVAPVNFVPALISNFRLRSADVVYYPTIHTAPTRLPRKTVITIQDVTPMLFPDHFPDSYLMWRERYYKIAHQATLITSPSASSADDISKYLDIPRERIVVVPHGVTELPIDPRYPLPKEPYMVAVGAEDYHKNLETILMAMRLLKKSGIRLYIAGRDDLKDMIRSMGLEDMVICVGTISDIALGSLIKGAVALVFPSLYEGFGLPPMEALALGVPVICSWRPAMNELLSECAIFVEARDHVAWANAILELLNNPKSGEILAKKGQIIVQQYTWEASAKMLLNVLESVL